MSFRRLEVSTTNQIDSCTLQEQKRKSLSLCRNAFLSVSTDFIGIDLATCFGELTHFFICQNDTSIEFHALVPFGASRLSEDSLHIESVHDGK